MRLNIALEIDKEIYEKYGENRFDLKTKLFRKMCVENKKQIINHKNLHCHLPIKKSTFDKIHSDNLPNISPQMALVIAIALTNSYDEACIYLMACRAYFYKEKGTKYEMYHDLMEKYCKNDKCDGIDRLYEVNNELREKGYSVICEIKE